jgi:hypothetical protein
MALIAVDFDGTIVEHEWPRIGPEMPGAFQTLRDLIEAGHHLILTTCREDVGHRIDKRYLTDAVNFCKDNGVEFVGVNETPIEHDFRQDWPTRRKVYANVYIDDTNLGGFPGWHVVRSVLGLPRLGEDDGNQYGNSEEV